VLPRSAMLSAHTPGAARMLALAQAGLHRNDWIVLGAYGALLVASGIYFSIRQRQRGTEDYFLASHRMPVWAVAFSILATAQSAATFVGAPEAAYSGNLTYLSTNIGGILAAVLLATVVIPAYYRKRVTTPYQLLESRFGPGAKEATSLTYMIGRVFAGGARLFIGALPASLALFGDITPPHLLVCIAAFTVFGILYTLWGGVSSVIWTDVIQVCVYLGAAIAAVVVLLNRIPAPVSEIVSALADPPGDVPSKLTLIKLGVSPFDPSAGFTLLTALFGFSLITLASHGADQDLVQRMLTCKSAAKGSWSVISGVLIGIPAVTLFLVLGLLLYIFYHRPDIMNAGAPASAPAGDKVVMTFALGELRGGLAGLVLAGLFAAGPCGINASLNSMSSTFVSDFYRPRRPGRDERHYLRVSRLGVAAAGVLVGGFAAACIVYYDPAHSTLLDLALGVMSFAYAGLLGVFFTALFTRRGNTRSVIAALLTGFVVVLILNRPVWNWWTGFFSSVDADGAVIRAIPAQRLAFPWHLLIGSIVATLVCLAGRPRQHANE
jgi:SSS family solute:Na+ symporter